MSLAQIVNNLFNIYWWLLIVRIFLTWVPSINWENQPFKFLRIVVDPVLAPFRAIIPPLGGLDFSPIIAILFLQFAQVAIVRLLVYVGV
ncbi:MAG: YggT family protein [Candidatus Gastranaerophilales bacterium]|nr:YggT family protein [Candidatus Gastranaerophilales bacterium]